MAGEVVPFGQPGHSAGGGNGSSVLESRLRAVEGDIREIKADMKHLATKEDLQKLKVWWLTGAGIAGGLGGLLTWMVRVFSGSP